MKPVTVINRNTKPHRDAGRTRQRAYESAVSRASNVAPRRYGPASLRPRAAD